MAYHPKTLRLLALVQMIIGSLLMVFGFAAIFAVPHWSSYVGFGIWAGVWILVTGILGYVGARSNMTPNKCLIGTFMGFAITSIVIAGVVIICISIALAQFNDRLNYKYYNYYRRYYRINYYTAKNGAGIGSCILILAVAEFFIGLASSIYCCNAACCAGPSSPPAVAQNQQIMYLPQQQQVPGQVQVVNPSGALPNVQTFPASQPMYVQQGQPMYYATTAGVPVSAAGGAPMVVASQAGQPTYFGSPYHMPVTSISQTAIPQTVVPQSTTVATPGPQGATSQAPAMAGPPPYK